MTTPQQDEQRQSERYAVHDLICDAGTLVDLSGDGASIERHTYWDPGKVRVMGLRSGGQQIRLDAECVHIEQVDEEHYRVGVVFPQATPAQRAALERLAAIHAGY
jgi:hypothetical protein